MDREKDVLESKNRVVFELIERFQNHRKTVQFAAMSNFAALLLPISIQPSKSF